MADEIGEADERQGGDAGEGQLYDGVVRTVVFAVAGGAGEEEVGGGGDDEGEEDEDRPRQTRRPDIGLIDAHPPQVRPEAPQLILRVRHASQELLAVVVVGPVQ